MKIYHWIDKYNNKVAFKIINKYSHGISAGKSTLYSLHTSFWGKYLLRLLLVFASIISFKKEAYKSFFKIISSKYSPFYSPDLNSVAYIKFRDLIATLFGYRYFVSEDISPLFDSRTILKTDIKFRITEPPLVSIIIPVYNHLDYTFNCLQSLLKNISNKISYEIIIIDDCSKDETNTFFKKCVTGLRYYRNETNAGFIKSCNLGARNAKGKLICFLNNDVQILPNWLETLVKTLENKNFGCVGSKLIYANGILQEAGGIVYNDANAANYGKYQNTDHPKFNFQREVDYCSGASLIFRKDEFEKLGNFNTEYIPAYYEDTDICFRVRHILGKKVIYQPLSQLIHFEGISSGTNMEEDSIKKYQKVNNLKFAKIWQSELTEYPNLGSIETAVKKYSSKKTILFIDDTIPTPNKDSGSVRLFEILKMTKSLGFEIIFVPNDGEKNGNYFNDIILLGVAVVYRFPNRKAMLNLLTEQVKDIDLVWICKPHNNTPFEFLFNLKPELKRIYDTIDLHYIRLKREADLTKNTVLEREAELIKNNELQFAKKADFTIAITNDEQQILKKEGIKNTIVIPNIHEENFSENGFSTFKERSGLVFIGGYSHKPNIDAVKWLIEEIMPIVWKVNPEIKVTLLGSNPPAEVSALQSSKVCIPGFIDDVSGYFNTSRVFVAPLRFGAGMKGKIGQSLSYALPIITTAIGAEGIGLTPDKDYLLANNAVDFAKQILTIYNDENVWNNVSNASKEIIKQYHPDRIKEILKALFTDLSSK